MTDVIALVTGASRGLGRGIAVGLAEQGVTVILTGRSGDDLARTAEQVVGAGGRAFPMVCDHRDDQAVAGVFATVGETFGRLDMLVNNATTLPAVRTVFTPTPFWETPLALWDDLIGVGLRSHYVAARHAAGIMLPRGNGLIVNVSSAAAAFAMPAIVPYTVGKAALDRMTADIATHLTPHGITAVSVWPPPSSTEGMLAGADETDDPAAWSTPLFTGRVIAVLAADPHLADRAGKAWRVRELAAELGVADQLYHP